MVEDNYSKVISGIIFQLQLYFRFPFVRYALLVGVLIALCSALLGVVIVQKQLSFIGTGLSNVAFGATAIAAAMQFTNNIIIVLSVTVISSVFLLRASYNTKINGDAMLAMISVSAIAIGYLIMNIWSRTANVTADVCIVLFGSTSILTLSMTEVWLCAGLSLLVAAVFVIFYYKIFTVTFDEDFASASGIKVGFFNAILAVFIAIVIVVAIRLVGALLISALVIFPALSAMRVFKSFSAVSLSSVVFSVICTATGILVSILASTPVGATVVAVNIAGFLFMYAVGMFRRFVQ